MTDNLLEVRGLTKYFKLDNDMVSRLAGKTRTLKAVDGIDFFIKPVSYTHLTLPTKA